MDTEYVALNRVGHRIPNHGFIELMAEVLGRKAPFRFQARGFSMSPFICDGDLITMVTLPNRIRFGSVVAFVDPVSDRLTIHRILGVSGDRCLCRGDNLQQADGWVPRSRILGCVTRIEHRGRSLCFGLGWERIIIASLSRLDLLRPLIALARRIWLPLHGRRLA